jgi:hypothetical protein
MQNVYQPINSLISEICGTTRVLSILFSRKTALIVGLIILGVTAWKLFFS